LTQNIGVSYTVPIPALSDVADITEALKYLYQGGLSGSPATNSIEQYLVNINSRATAIETAVGWPYSNGSSIDARLTSLESTVGGSLSSTYVKSAPSSNSTAATRNLISPTVSTVIPLQVQGIVGQSASLQEWKTSAETVAKVDNTGRLFSHNGSAMEEVVTLTGTQTLANKTLSTPIQTVGTNSKATSYTLVLSDQSKLIEMNSGSAVTLTVPTDASVAFPVGTYIVVVQMGAGQVTIGGAGVTFVSALGLNLRAQYSMATLIKRGTNSWIVSGDTTV
jgi:hypothetical protein